MRVVVGEDGYTTFDVARWSHQGLINVCWKYVNSYPAIVVISLPSARPQERQGNHFVLSPTSRTSDLWTQSNTNNPPLVDNNHTSCPCWLDFMKHPLGARAVFLTVFGRLRISVLVVLVSVTVPPASGTGESVG